MRFECPLFRISEISLREAKLNSQFSLRLRKFSSARNLAAEGNLTRKANLAVAKPHLGH